MTITIQRLAELAAIIAEKEGGDLVVQVNDEPVVDLCLSEDGVVYIRT